MMIAGKENNQICRSWTDFGHTSEKLKPLLSEADADNTMKFFIFSKSQPKETSRLELHRAFTHQPDDLHN